MVTPFRDDHARRSRRRAGRSPRGSSTTASDAIVVAGSTGESPTLTHKEKARALPRGGRRDPRPRQADLRHGHLLHGRDPRAHAGRRGRRRRRPPRRDPVLQQAAAARARSRTSSASPTPPSCRSSSTTSPAAPRPGSSTTPCCSSPQRPNIVAVKDSTGDFQGDLAADRRGARGLRGLLGRRLGDLRLRVPRGGRRRERREPPGGPADPADDRPDRDRRRAGGPQDPRVALAAVQRPVHHLEPDPREGRARDAGPPGRAAAPAAGARHHRGDASASARPWRMPVSSDAAALPVKVVFLGGVGEVGRNMACIEVDDRILIVDVGLSFPSRRHARHRPGAARTSTTSAATPIGSRRSCSRTVTRTTSGRFRTSCASSTTCPSTARRSRWRCLKGKLEEHEVADRCRAPHRGPRGGRHGRSVHDAVPARDALDPRRHGGGGRHAVRHDPAHRATSRSTRPRSTGGPPTCTASPRRRAARACTCCCQRLDERRGGRLHVERAQRGAGRAPTSSRTRPRSWWRRASPATSTGCSRS